MASYQGYKCEFIGSISEDFYCKKCTLVARRLTLTSCCGESFCQTCIADTQEQGQSCPVCGVSKFTTYEHLRSQKRICGLQVYCNMKERGCVWSGTLDQLDTHLDPHLDNCQYVDTKCPQNCLQTIPKNKVDQHVTQDCTKRRHVCKHCGFKATYEEVVETHLPECKYVPLQCPNMCGVSCDREVMEDHKMICRLEEVECEFSSVGCDGRFTREDQDEHARQNSHKHLTLTASLAVETKEQLQQKLLEQDKKHKKEEETLTKKIKEQEKKLEEQEKKLGGQEKKLEEQEKKLLKPKEEEEKVKRKLEEQEKKLQEKDEEITELKQMLQETVAKSKLNERSVLDFFKMTVGKRTFVMKNFRKKRAKKTQDWKSPAMYTHLGGYKFCIGVDVNGYSIRHNSYVTVDIVSMPGEFDDQLKWPADMKLTLELLHQHGGQNLKLSYSCKLIKPDKIAFYPYDVMVSHSDVRPFLTNDTLYFHVSTVKVL